MSEFSTPLPSGMRVKDIQTTSAIVNGKTVVTPVLDSQGKEIEIYAVQVPQSIEAVEGTAAERKAVLDGFVADMQAKEPEIALLRATARIDKQDPEAAETAFTAAQALGVAVDAAVDAAAAQPGGKS